MANVAPGSRNTDPRYKQLDEILGRFANISVIRDGPRETFKELLAPAARGTIQSRLLVRWESRGRNFRQNLREAFVPSFQASGAIVDHSVAVPEIWSKRTLLKRLQSLSLSYHVVLVAFVVAPFLPELMAPATTHAKSTPWVSTPLIAPYTRASTTAVKTPKGGGSGGDRDSRPETTGRVPVFSHIQLTPPSARPPVNPAMAAPPTLIGSPELSVKSPDMPTWGNPASPFKNDSNGPGYGGGIGNNRGGGIGDDGDGPGLGPGRDGGTGGNDYEPGANGVGYPVCVYCPSPQYSEDAVKTKYQGVVLLLVTVTADGRAANIRVVKAIGGGLDEMAVAAVRTWRFRPAVGPDNKPVSVKAPIEVTFRLY
jgi:TonB family protein